MIYADAREQRRGRLYELNAYHDFRLAAFLVDPGQVQSGQLPTCSSHTMAVLLDALTANKQLELYLHLLQVGRAYDLFERFAIPVDTSKLPTNHTSVPDQAMKSFLAMVSRSPNAEALPVCYDLCNVASGRTSTRGFPWQSIKRSSEYTQCFPAPAGFIYASCDWRQAEIRIAQALSHDSLLKTDLDAGDLYLQWAGHWQISREQAKEVIIATIYGQSLEGLVRQHGELASWWQTELFTRYRELRDWLGYERHLAKGREWVWSVYGRRMRTEHKSESQILNFPVQSALADTKLVVIRRLMDLGYVHYLRLDYHDELIFCLDRPELLKEIVQVMSRPQSSWYFQRLKHEFDLPVQVKISSSLDFSVS